MILVKKHKTRFGQLILAICDSDIKGKKFTDNDMQLDLSTGFYDGEEMSEEDIKKLFKMAYIVNIVGEKSIESAIKSKIINKENIIKISGIPHAQCIIVREE